MSEISEFSIQYVMKHEDLMKKKTGVDNMNVALAALQSRCDNYFVGGPRRCPNYLHGHTRWCKHAVEGSCDYKKLIERLGKDIAEIVPEGTKARMEKLESNPESEGAGMRIYKFLQHEEWPVLIAAENRSKAKYQLYRFAQMMSRGGYDSFMECLKDFKSAGTISYEEAQKLIDADDCDADFGVYQIERAEK